MAAETGHVHSMHDPTEGGVMTGLVEIARAAGVGLSVELDAIPVPELSARLCAEFGLDPLGTIASGAILIAAAPDAAQGLVTLLGVAGYPTVRIGRVEPAESGLSATRNGRPAPWPHFATDEVTRLFT
jgi:hydrogenase maturation factor